MLDSKFTEKEDCHPPCAPGAEPRRGPALLLEVDVGVKSRVLSGLAAAKGLPIFHPVAECMNLLIFQQRDLGPWTSLVSVGE